MRTMVWVDKIYITSILMYEGPTLITVEQHPFIRQYGAKEYYEKVCNELLSQGYSIIEEVKYKKGSSKSPRVMPYTILKRTPTAQDYIKIWWDTHWDD